MKVIKLIPILTFFVLAGCQATSTEVSSSKSNENKTVPVKLVLTADEVAKHSIEQDCWLIIANKVYDVTGFINEHPGGSFRIIPNCGKDATQGFETQGGRGQHSADAYKLLPEYLIGEIGSEITK